MNKQLLLLTLLLTSLCSFASRSTTYPYKSAQIAWEEKFGNHRAVLQIKKKVEVAELSFEWRRPDMDVDKRMLLIVNAETGDTIQNINRIIVNNDICKIKFGPIKKAGTYYFYYLPYQVQPGYGFYNRGYYAEEQEPNNDWLQKANSTKKPVSAKIIGVESRTEFDSFYPMEVAANKTEIESYSNKNSDQFFAFPESRENPIRMKRKIPIKWLSIKNGDGFKGVAQPNEYYTFQVGIWAPKRDISNISYKFSDLKSGNDVISYSKITCFNTEGIDPYGNAFEKRLDVGEGTVQPLWFGIDISDKKRAGVYKGTIEITDDNNNLVVIPVQITIAGDIIADRGDSEPWRHSRLRWLNSTIGVSDKPTEKFTNVEFEKNQISILGRNTTINPKSGLPEQIDSWNNLILNSPIQFIIETEQGIKEVSSKIIETKQTDGSVSLSLRGEDNDFIIETNSISEFDGWSNYSYKVTPKKNLKVLDIRLEIDVNKNIAQYFMGAGMPGQATPSQFEGKWDTPEMLVNETQVSIPVSKQANWLWPFDSFWIGNASAGIHVELNGSTYSGPLLNLYRPKYPTSWHNEGKGGFSLKRYDKSAKMIVYSGERSLVANEPIKFEFSTIVTPVKQINYNSQFEDRYYHNAANPAPTEEDVKAGVKVINIHHANDLNPVINYPFLTVDKLKDFTTEWHNKDSKVKLYYTIRELTNAVTEIWALRSLGDEILGSGDSGDFKAAGGFPWLREHLVTGYTPQWYQHLEDVNELGITADASILTSTNDSRWFNYYIEGLAWLVKNVGIDGIYLDDVSYDRRILKRMRRAMDSVKEGCIIDLHSNTGFSRGPATQYTEYFPYVDKIWFGESFMYNSMSPENWLVEVSGIPFGVMGDMLHAGGNKWLGMQYGMTVRQPWMTEGLVIDPRPVWKVWDDFGIESSQMVGFWDASPTVISSDDNVKVTTYIKDGKTLLSIGNYTDDKKEVKLNIDWDRLGINPESAKMMAPTINEFQRGRSFKIDEPISIDPRRGWLIIIN